MKAGPPAIEPHSFDLDLVEDDPLTTSPLVTHTSDVEWTEVDCSDAKPPATHTLSEAITLASQLLFTSYIAVALVDAICIYIYIILHLVCSVFRV